MTRTQARMKRERPITDKYQLWANWLMGAASYYHPGAVTPPVHPDTAQAFHDGRAAALSGLVVVPSLDEAWSLARHVLAGQPPHTFNRR